MRKRSIWIVSIFVGLLVVGCDEPKEEQPPEIGAAQAGTSDIHQATGSSDNPFVALVFKSAMDMAAGENSGKSRAAHPQKALESLVATGADLLDSEISWQCRTESIDGRVSEVSVRLLDDKSGFVNYEPITWEVGSGDELKMTLPGKGSIRWQNIRFAIAKEGFIRMKAEDRKGEIALCDLP